MHSLSAHRWWLCNFKFNQHQIILLLHMLFLYTYNFGFLTLFILKLIGNQNPNFFQNVMEYWNQCQGCMLSMHSKGLSDDSIYCPLWFCIYLDTWKQFSNKETMKIQHCQPPLMDLEIGIFKLFIVPIFCTGPTPICVLTTGINCSIVPLHW